MCWICDDRTSTPAGDHEAVPGGGHGWAVQYVPAGPVRPSVAYTVGLTGHRRPELVITGLPAAQVHPLLDAEARRSIEEGLPPAGGQLRLTNGWVAEVVDVPHPDAHLPAAAALFGSHRLCAAQLVWADDRGRWPWERAFRRRRGGQPVLGPRAG